MRGEILLFLILSGLWSLSSCDADRQFHYVKEKMTGRKAQSYCRNNYHDLASLLNMEDISNLLKNRELHLDRVNTAWAWIGLFDDKRNWTWSLNSTGHHNGIHFTNWGHGEPNDQRGKQICTVINDAGYWNDEPCDKGLYSVCYNGSAYFFQDTKRSWFEAQKYCRDEHMDLARVMDETENTEISKILRWYTWLGLYRKPWAYWSEQLSVNFTHWDVGACYMLEKQGMSDFKLRWTQRDGTIFHREEEEEPKKN